MAKFIVDYRKLTKVRYKNLPETNKNYQNLLKSNKLKIE